jgi:3-mercaptopyruvate sulfurtransferase SseA
MSKRLMELKHKDVRTLRGGLRAWADAGLELDTGDG